MSFQRVLAKLTPFGKSTRSGGATGNRLKNRGRASQLRFEHLEDRRLLSVNVLLTPVVPQAGVHYGDTENFQVNIAITAPDSIDPQTATVNLYQQVATANGTTNVELASAGVAVDGSGNGSAALSIASLSAGTHEFFAEYQDANTAAVDSAVAALNVVPAPLSVVVNNQTQVFGDPLPTLTGTVTGVVNGDNITASYSTTAQQFSSVVDGGYAITAALNDPQNVLSNYTVTITNGTLTVTPAPLTVTTDSLSKVYGQDVTTQLGGSISGALNGDDITATYASSGAAATANVGSYLVNASLSGNDLGNYAVTDVNGALVVNKAPLTVTTNSLSKTYGQDVTTQLGGSIAGILNGDDITATYTSPGATTTANVGTYLVNASVTGNGTGRMGDYAVTYVKGSLVVDKASLTVTTNSLEKTYGQDVTSQLGGSIAGILNGDDITATYSSPGTAATANVGTYLVNASVTGNGTGRLGDYDITYVKGSLIVNQAPLMVTTNSLSKTYGQDVTSQLGGSIAGILNGDDITATYSSPGAAATANVGTYLVNVAVTGNGTGRMGDYAITYVKGSLVVDQAPLTVTTNSLEKTYGQDVTSQLGGSIAGILNGDDITAAYTSPGAAATANVGTYLVNVAVTGNGTGRLGDYDITYVKGSLVVNQAPLTVTTNSLSKVYGQDVTSLISGNIAGILNGDDITATYTSPGAAATANVGTYLVNASVTGNGTGRLGDYAITYVKGSLVVNQAPLTVTTNSLSKVYGQDATSLLSGSIAGILNGDDITAAYTSPGAAATANVGTYLVNAAVTGNGTGRLGDYDVTYVKGSLTVNAAATTISLAAPTVSTLGQPVTLTATVTSTAGVATGYVAITVDGGSRVLVQLVNGVATYTLPKSLSLGSHTFTVQFVGSLDYGASNTLIATDLVQNNLA